MKKNSTMRVMVGMLCVTAMMSATAFAATGQVDLKQKVDVPNQEQVKEAGNYMTVGGTIISAEKKDDYYRVEIENNTMGMVFNISSTAFVVDQKTGTYLNVSDLTKGMKITAILAKNAPMTMSIPAQTSGAIGFVVNSEAGSVDVSVYNDELTNVQNTLKLNVSENTKIVHQNGAKKVFTAEDMKGNECVVLYTVTTRSIPAQTNPEFVMILNQQTTTDATGDAAAKEVTKAEDKDTVVYTELRKGAEAKGYTVTWTSNQKPIVLTKDGTKIEITVGSDSFEFAHDTKDIKPLDKMEKMNGPAKLENGKIMVSTSFMEAME